ncbi:MAG: cytochrome c1 [Pseudomonadota bacterium]
MAKSIKTLTLLALLFAVTSVAYAAGGGKKYEPSGIQPDNIPSLQRGAANFMNYCSGCHSAQYVRYSTIGSHLGISDELLIQNLMFNAEKTFDTIQVAMPYEGATRWFGKAPPDLSLTARAKSADYIYAFLRSYYLDDSRPTGVNNTELTMTAMPHVLWELQGFQTASYEDVQNEDGSIDQVFRGFEQAIPGKLTPEEYDEFVRDTVNFLAYIAEPVRSERRVIGIWVLMFLLVLLILSYLLKKEIWKDVK